MLIGAEYHVERTLAPGAADGERFKCPDAANMVEGVPHPPFIRPRTWGALKDLSDLSKDGDIWVATFPKCGTTFTEQIILLLQSGGDDGKFNATDALMHISKSTDHVGAVVDAGAVPALA